MDFPKCQALGLPGVSLPLLLVMSHQGAGVLQILVAAQSDEEVDHIKAMLVLDLTTADHEILDMEVKMVDSVHHQVPEDHLPWLLVVVDGVMEQPVVPLSGLVKLFKAEVSNPMRILMLLLVVARVSSIIKYVCVDALGVVFLSSIWNGGQKFWRY